MPRIPTYRAKQLPSGNVGAAPISLDVASQGGGEGIPGRAEAQMFQGLENLGRGVSDFGQKMFQLEQRKQQLTDNNASIEAKRIRERGRIEFEKWKATNPHTEWARGQAQINEQMNSELASIDGVSDQWREATALESRFYNDTSMVRAETQATIQLGKESVEAADFDLTKSITQYGPDSQEAKESTALAVSQYKTAGFSDKQIEMRISDISATGAKAYREATQQVAEDAIAGMIEPTLKSGESWAKDQKISKEDRRRAYAMVDEAVDELVENGTLNKGDGFQLKKKLNNDIDNYAEEYTYEAASAKKQTKIDTYVGLAEKLDPSTPGTLTQDDLVLSGLTQAEQKEYQKVLDGSREPEPPKTTMKGLDEVNTIINGASVGTIGTGEAVNRLAKARFVDQTITDGQYTYGLNRIKNPYPPYFAETLKGIQNSAKGIYKEQGAGLFFGRDYIDAKERDAYVAKMSSLNNWVENYEKGTGKLPSPEETYEQMRQFGVSVGNPDTLPQRPVAVRPAPKQTDPTYVSSDADWDVLPVGAEFYDSITGQWMIKERE
jgi:hypothetical protein